MQPQIRGEILFEFVRAGDVVKASAIHVETDTEVCLVGPQGAGRYALQVAALRKLAYVLGKRPDRAQWLG